MSGTRRFDVTPSASRLLHSMRDIGYDFSTALADLVDNSVAAGASQVDVTIEFSADRSWVLVADNGSGMTATQLVEAMRLGSRREYAADDLGRFGLGMKTASLSQARRLTVLTRQARHRRRIAGACLDLDEVARSDAWAVTEPRDSRGVDVATSVLEHGPGTAVLLENLDRVLPERNPEGAWARRRLDSLATSTADYLGMVFHRFLEGAVAGHDLKITMNGTKVKPWSPYALQEPETQTLPVRSFEVSVGDLYGEVTFTPYVLPPRHGFSNPKEFERMSGPRKWNRQQGLYVYRADRLLQSGGWSGMRSADEHTKLARAALDFPPSLDPLFQTNVAKMRTSLPPQVRTLLEQPVHHLCKAAEGAYRRDGSHADLDPGATPREGSPRPASGELLLAVRSSAMAIGEIDALKRILFRLSQDSPEVAFQLGLR